MNRPIQPRTLKGFRDYLPEAMIPRERLIATARQVYRSYGFAPIDTPAEFLLGLLETPGSAELSQVLGPERLEEGRYFVVDPLGNLILSYPDDADQSRLLRDLERLLDVSRVG